MDSSVELPAVGTLLGGKYRIERALGEGGMGVVFEAVHAKLGQRVAIKMLRPALIEVPELVSRFEREARAAGQLRHRNTARVVDVDVTDAGVPYMVMEFLHGHDLDEELQARGSLPIAEAVHFVSQACAAMAEAHRLGIIHRDLKPSNLFLSDEADGSVCVKVLDFGISKVQTDDVKITSTASQMGTPLYMSPEQVRSAKNVDLRTDIWSLGVILYELLAGCAPFTGSAAGIGAAIVNDAPPSLRSVRPDVPEDIERAIEKAMSKNPADRFASTRDFAEAIASHSAVQVAVDSLPRVTAPRPPVSSSATIANAETLAAPSAKSATGGSWAVKETGAPKRSRLGIVAAVGIAGVLAVAGVVMYALRAPAGTTGASTQATVSSTASAVSVPSVVSASAAATTPPPPSVTASATARPTSTTTGRPTAHPTTTATTKPTIDNPARL